MDSHADTSHDAPWEWLEGLNRAILDSALDCIITMDASGRVREFNPAAERVFGYRRDEAVGEELATLIIPSPLRERHRQGLAHYLKTGEGPVLARRIEVAAVRKDGCEILVELAITAFRIKGEPVFTAYLREITERVRAERRRVAQYSVASLLAGSTDLAEVGPNVIQTIAAIGQWVFGSIWIREDAGGVLRCATTWQSDPAALRGFDEETRSTELAGTSGLPGRVVESEKHFWIPDVTSDPIFKRHDAARAAALRSGFAFPLRAANEVIGALELFSYSVTEPDDDLLQLAGALGSQIGLFIHRRRIENELQRQKEAAEAANAAKDRFLATLSHELRTPLTPVLMWAGSMAQHPELPGEIREGLEMVSRNVELEARLIDDLLDLTRVSRGKLQLNIREADGHELLRHAVDIVRSEFQRNNVGLDLKFDAPNVRLHVDAPRIQQVFWNVLRNAAKFTEPGGNVVVRTFNPAPDRFAVEVADTGIGIAPQHLERIFDAFEQIYPEREGLGLGLAISKAVIEMHGGSIRAESPGPGQGAMFVVQVAAS